MSLLQGQLSETLVDFTVLERDVYLYFLWLLTFSCKWIVKQMYSEGRF